MLLFADIVVFFFVVFWLRGCICDHDTKHVAVMAPLAVSDFLYGYVLGSKTDHHHHHPYRGMPTQMLLFLWF